MAAGFSIFDISQAPWPTSWRASFTSSPRCTNDSATQSTPRRSAKSRSFLSFSVRGPIGSTVSGRLMPLRLASMPPTSTVASMRGALLVEHGHADLAVVEQKRVAGLDRLENLWMRQKHALRPALVSRGVEAEDCALGQLYAAAVDLADTKFGPLQVGENADRPSEARLRRAQGGMHLLHRVEGGMAHVDAEHVHASLEQTLDHLRGVRCRSERGDDLDAPAASHLALAPPSLGSVRRMVQSLAS